MENQKLEGESQFGELQTPTIIRNIANNLKVGFDLINEAIEKAGKQEPPVCPKCGEQVLGEIGLCGDCI